jgi:hypothetical protein
VEVASAALAAKAATAARGVEVVSAAAEEALRAHIAEKWRRRAVKEMEKTQSRVVCTMAGLPRKEEKVEDDHGSDSSDCEQIRLDPFCVFNRYYRTVDGKGKGKSKGSHG